LMETGTIASGPTPLEAVTVKLNVPAAVGTPDRIPMPVNIKPSGTAPDEEKVIADGLPVAANRYDGKTEPTVAVAGGVEAVNAGGDNAATTPMLTDTVASGATPFEAVTRNTYRPVLNGVPERRPAGERLRPCGKAPDDTLKLMVDGTPEAVNVYEG
jgi:hypothetical protein